MIVHFENYDVKEARTEDIPKNKDANKEEHAPGQTIPQRIRQLPRRLADCELVPDNEVGTDEEMMHLTMFANAEPIDYQETLKKQARKMPWLKNSLP